MQLMTYVYPSELQLKNTTECTTLSYLDIHITIDNGKYSNAVFDQRDSFTFNIVNFPHLSLNIPSKPAYGVYISQLVGICRIRSNNDTIRLHQNSSNKDFGTRDCAWHSRHLQNIMQALSKNMDVVYENTLRRGYTFQPLMVS